MYDNGCVWCGHGWMMGLGWLVLIVIGVLLWRAFSSASPQRAVTDDRDPALDELRRRYAAGELDDEEFERRLAKLRETDH